MVACMCILGVIFWNLFYPLKHRFKKILGTVTMSLMEKYRLNLTVTASGVKLQVFLLLGTCCCWNIPLILTSSMSLGVNRHECVCVCSQQASHPWARSKVRWGGRELWEMKPSWTWITFAHNGASRSSDTSSCLKDSQGTNWKKNAFTIFFDMWLYINLPSLSLSFFLALSLYPTVCWTILIGRKQNSVDGANLFYKEPVIALNIREWIQHLSALKTWIAALEG